MESRASQALMPALKLLALPKVASSQSMSPMEMSFAIASMILTRGDRDAL